MGGHGNPADQHICDGGLVQPPGSGPGPAASGARFHRAQAFRRAEPSADPMQVNATLEALTRGTPKSTLEQRGSTMLTLGMLAAACCTGQGYCSPRHSRGRVPSPLLLEV